MRCARDIPTNTHTLAVSWAAVLAMTAPTVVQVGMSRAARPTLTTAATAVAVSAQRRSPTARSAAHATPRIAESSDTPHMMPTSGAAGRYASP